MIPNDPLFTNRPNHSYHYDDEAWHRYVFWLASTYGMQRKDVAAMCGIKTAAMDNHVTTMDVWARGQAVFKNKIWAKMLDVALDEPTNYSDPAEKAQVRALAADMNKHIVRIFEKREELAGVHDDNARARETLAKLSDAELRAKAELLLRTPR